jgi:hypothetical protein
LSAHTVGGSLRKCHNTPQRDHNLDPDVGRGEAEESDFAPVCQAFLFGPALANGRVEQCSAAGGPIRHPAPGGFPETQ